MCAEKFHQGLKEIGLECFIAAPGDRNPTVTTIKVPEGVDWKAVTEYAMEKHDLEIPGGLGPTDGKVWRIGLMCQNANVDKVEFTLRVLEEAINHVKAK